MCDPALRICPSNPVPRLAWAQLVSHGMRENKQWTPEIVSFRGSAQLEQQSFLLKTQIYIMMLLQDGVSVKQE